jgi:hypothetical protein
MRSWLCSVFIFLSAPLRAEDSYELPPIHYSLTEPNDAVSALKQQALTWDNSSHQSLLKQLMQRLHVPEASQVLVFSKTSKQKDLISPQTPRAIWFGDDAYLGYAMDGLIEVTTIDPVLGAIFYTVDPEAKSAPQFQRDESCLSCHGGSFTDGVPGVHVRSVTPSVTGQPLFSQGSILVNAGTPFSERWGGWYVTGQHGKGVHRGNTLALEQGERVLWDASKGQNVQNLQPYFDTKRYLRDSSDVVALMLLEHQTGVQNALTKANQTILRVVHIQQSLAKELGESLPPEPSGSALRIIEHCVEDVLDALLFKDEALLPAGGIEGSAEFVTQFTALGRRAKDGRSLKDLQCLERLFKYRCSYMIYGVTFTHMQQDLRRKVLDRLKHVLRAGDSRYAYLAESERKHIHKILADTLTGLPKDW